MAEPRCDTPLFSSEPRDADPPFNDTSADVILRTLDRVDFYVHKIILSFLSPIFKDIFALPAAADRIENIPVVDMAEESHIMDFILRCCYPTSVPTLTELKDIKRVLAASDKYDITRVRDMAKAALEGCIERDPLGVFAVACRMEFPDICQKAAKQTLQYSLQDLDSDSPDFRLMPAVHFQKLVQYHCRCGAAASRHIADRACLSEGAGGLPLTRRGGSIFCSSCMVQDDDGVYSWWGPAGLWRYLERADKALQTCPHRSTVLRAEITSTWKLKTCQSSFCRYMYSSHSFIEDLANQIDRVVAKVKMPEFC